MKAVLLTGHGGPEMLRYGEAPDPVAGKWLVGHYLRSDPVVFLNRQLGADADGLDGERQDGTPEAFELAVRIGAGRKQGPAQREHGRPTAGDDVAGLLPIVADQLGDDNGATYCRTPLRQMSLLGGYVLDEGPACDLGVAAANGTPSHFWGRHMPHRNF